MTATGTGGVTAPDVARTHLALMLVLTFTTGIVDATGYLGLDRVFTANMTGNVVILGMALADEVVPSGAAHSLPVVGPLLAFLAFTVGAAGAGRRLRRTVGGWTGQTTKMFLVTGLGSLTLGIACVIASPRPETRWGYCVTALLAILTGIQAATARKLAVTDVTTVVVTSTITGLAADSRFAGGTGRRWRRRALAIVLILAGAAVGALLLEGGVATGLIVAGVIISAATGAGHRLAGPASRRCCARAP